MARSHTLQTGRRAAIRYRSLDALEGRPNLSQEPLVSLLGRDALAVADTSAGYSAQEKAALKRWRPANKLFVRSQLQAVEDNRTWSPNRRLKKPLGIRQWRPPLVAAKTIKSKTVKSHSRPLRSHRPSWAIQFKSPSGVALCIRRKLRTKAILATGNGGGNHKRPRRNFNSQIWC